MNQNKIKIIAVLLLLCISAAWLERYKIQKSVQNLPGQWADKIKQITDEPQNLYAQSAVLMDADSGRILFEKNGSEIDITGVKNIETTISIGDKEISKNNISDLSEGDTYILNVNDNTFRRTEKIENNNVNAKVKVGKIKLLGVSKKISEGKKIVLKTVISPNNASNKTIVWKSSNPKVATVTQSGIVTMKKKTGGKKVAITAIATDGSNKYASWKITSMKGVVKKVKINGKKRIKAGKTLKLKAKILATKHANKKLLWKSNNSKLATVNQKGVVKVHKKAKGKTIKITAFATDGSNKKSTIKIKVK